jgi:hypothetical protein
MAAMAWSVETLNETVDAELADLPGGHVRHVRGQL